MQKGCASVQYDVEINGRLRQVVVNRVDGQFVVSLEGREWTIDATRVNPNNLSLLMAHESHEVTLANDLATGGLLMTVNGVPIAAALNTRKRWGRKDAADGASGPQRMLAPMPGKVVRILANVGDAVRARQPLVVVEAMKMENELRAGRDGVVAEIHAREGQSVDAGALLLVVSPA